MSDDNEETTLELRGLDQLIRIMGLNPPSIKVGILGSHGVRSAQGNSHGSNNAEIGASHEFGTSTLPQRSFLRVPLADHLNKEMESSGALDEDVLKDTIQSGDLIPYMKKIAALAQTIVLQAFDSGGDGKWKPSNMARKKVKQTLVESQQLRNSISTEIKNG